MVHKPKLMGALALRLMVGLALLGCPRLGVAQGTWSLISLPQKPGQVYDAAALAVDATGNLYVADQGGVGGRIQQRDAQGNWSVLAAADTTPGQIDRPITALAVDAAGDLYVADSVLNDSGPGNGRIWKRDAQGNWSVIAQVRGPSALAADAAGNLYVAENQNANVTGEVRSLIQKRDAQGNWSMIATQGSVVGQVWYPPALAVDTLGNLYLAESNIGRIQKRDPQGNWSVIATRGASALAVDARGNLDVAGGDIQQRDPQGNWSVIATPGTDLGQVNRPHDLAVDATGNLYVTDSSGYPNAIDRLHKRDAQGNWSVIAAAGTAPGQVNYPTTLAMDIAGNLYVADYAGNVGRIQKRDAQGNWSAIATGGTALGQVWRVSALAVDAEGNLYVADQLPSRIQQRDAQGNWSMIATTGTALGQVHDVSGLAVDTAGNLYVSDDWESWIQKRDAQGNWSRIFIVFSPAGAHALARDAAGSLFVAAGGALWKRDAQGNWSFLDTGGSAPGYGWYPEALAADAGGNLYGAVGGVLWKRDAQGKWFVIAPFGAALGQVANPSDLAVDMAGNLYVADYGNQRVLKYTPQP
jgi:tripartite motif-containing protein 71